MDREEGEKAEIKRDCARHNTDQRPQQRLQDGGNGGHIVAEGRRIEQNRVSKMDKMQSAGILDVSTRDGINMDGALLWAGIDEREETRHERCPLVSGVLFQCAARTLLFCATFAPRCATALKIFDEKPMKRKSSIRTKV